MLDVSSVSRLAASRTRSYWPMPFHEGARITLENIGHETACVYYQVDVETGDPIRFAHRLDRPSTVRPALPGRDLLSV